MLWNCNENKSLPVMTCILFSFSPQPFFFFAVYQRTNIKWQNNKKQTGDCWPEYYINITQPYRNHHHIIWLFYIHLYFHNLKVIIFINDVCTYLPLLHLSPPLLFQMCVHFFIKIHASQTGWCLCVMTHMYTFPVLTVLYAEFGHVTYQMSWVWSRNWERNGKGSSRACSPVLC